MLAFHREAWAASMGPEVQRDLEIFSAQMSPLRVSGLHSAPL